MSAEPVATYGVRRSTAMHNKKANSTQERVMANTVSVDEYFDEATRGFGKVHQRRRRAYSEGYESMGYRAGQDALRSARMGGQMALNA